MSDQKEKFVTRKEFQTLEARVTLLETLFLPTVAKRSPKLGDYPLKRRKKKKTSRRRPRTR
jgi:hypothetical protein